MPPENLLRRHLLATGLSLCAYLASARAVTPGRPVMARVIIDNDFSGDPDGLFALAHHLLCSSVSVPFIIGSHLPAHFQWDHSAHPATDAAAKVRQLLKIMQREDHVIAGAEQGMSSRSDWVPSPATEAIVLEAMRGDTNAPLFYAAGAGLTELALAWLTEPRIGRRLKLVWIGGGEHAGLAYPPPGPPEAEFNFTIDPIAAQVIFNDSDIEIWQVPRDAYRQMLFSVSELRDLADSGALGRYLKDQIDRINAMIDKLSGANRVPSGETYVLGDSPLVTLTALQSFFQPDPSSSRYQSQPTPRLNERGDYELMSNGRPMRIYTAIDSGLTFRDMTSKFRAFSHRQAVGHNGR
jgi:purine nucleosidase